MGLAITSGNQMRRALGAKHSTSLCSHLPNYQDRVLSVTLSLPGGCGQGAGNTKAGKTFFPRSDPLSYREALLEVAGWEDDEAEGDRKMT